MTRTTWNKGQAEWVNEWIELKDRMSKWMTRTEE